MLKTDSSSNHACLILIRSHDGRCTSSKCHISKASLRAWIVSRRCSGSAENHSRSSCCFSPDSSRQYSYCPSAWPTGPYHLNNRCSSQSFIVTSSRNRSSASTSSMRHQFGGFCTKTRRKRPVSVAGHNALARRVHARQNIAARRLSQHLAGRDGGQVRDRLPRGGAHGRARRARPPMLQQSRGARGPANGACSRAGREMLHLEGPVVLIVVGARGRFELRGLRMRRCCAPAEKAATDAAVQR